MGLSDPHIHSFYNHHIKPKGSVALLGFTDNNFFDGDLYDLQLSNWNINSEWDLPKKYDTIISLRCPYFSKDPEDFIRRCYDNLSDDGVLYADWGLGDHWRFDNYKVGWLKNGEHECAYAPDNFLWSTVWDDDFLNDTNYNLFCQRVEKFGYENVKSSIIEEVPEILQLKDIKKYFNISYNIMALWEDSPQLYILLSCDRRKET